MFGSPFALADRLFSEPLSSGILESLAGQTRLLFRITYLLTYGMWSDALAPRVFWPVKIVGAHRRGSRFRVPAGQDNPAVC